MFVLKLPSVIAPLISTKKDSVTLTVVATAPLKVQVAPGVEVEVTFGKDAPAEAKQLKAKLIGHWNDNIPDDEYNFTVSRIEAKPAPEKKTGPMPKRDTDVKQW